MLFLLDPLEGEMASSHGSFRHQMSAVFRWFLDIRVLCLSGFSSYSLISLCFFYGEFYKVSQSCPSICVSVSVCLCVPAVFSALGWRADP